MRYLTALVIFLLGGLLNAGDFTKTIERESISLVEQYFSQEGEIIKYKNLDVSLGQVEMLIKTEKSEYFVVSQVSNYWIISTLLSYFVRPKVSIQSIVEVKESVPLSN